MNTLNERTVLDEMATEVRHFDQAPAAFFQAWQRGVKLAGFAYFGDGTREQWERATDKWALCPDVALIRRAIGAMSSGEKVFLSAMVSFYNSRDGGALLKRVGVRGLADLGNLDLERRNVIAALLLNYNGW